MPLPIRAATGRERISRPALLPERVAAAPRSDQTSLQPPRRGDPCDSLSTKPCHFYEGGRYNDVNKAKRRKAVGVLTAVDATGSIAEHITFVTVAETGLNEGNTIDAAVIRKLSFPS